MFAEGLVGFFVVFCFLLCFVFCLFKLYNPNNKTVVHFITSWIKISCCLLSTQRIKDNSGKVRTFIFLKSAFAI